MGVGNGSCMENPVAQPGCRGKMGMIGYFYFPHGPSLSFVIDLSALFWFLLTIFFINHFLRSVKMRKSLLFVLVAVLLTAMTFSTASAGHNGNGPGYDEDSGPCICDVSIDLDLDGICDVCGHCIPHGDCEPDGDGEPDRNRDRSCQD